MQDSDTRFWEAAGRTSDYNSEWKRKVFKHIKRVLNREAGGAGNMIVDVGSGPYPVSRYLAHKDSKSLLIDINPPFDKQPRERHIQRNVRDLLGFMQSSRRPFASTFIFSDILNYIPYQEALSTAYSNLKPGGCIVVVNQPGRTFDHARHTLLTSGVQSTEQMQDFIDELGLHTLHSDTTKDGYHIGVYQKPL